jgi:hypothetical protein
MTRRIKLLVDNLDASMTVAALVRRGAEGLLDLMLPYR